MNYSENTKKNTIWWISLLIVIFIQLVKGDKLPEYDFVHRKAGLLLLPSINFHYNEVYEDILEPKTVSTFVDFVGERPPNMFLGGHDCDKNPYFIGRTVHKGQMVVGRVAVDDVLYIGYEDSEYPKLEFQVLVNGTAAGAKWSQADHAAIKHDIQHPFIAGTWKRRPMQQIYVCRATTENCNVIPGYAIEKGSAYVCITSTNNKCFENKQFEIIINHRKN